MQRIRRSFKVSCLSALYPPLVCECSQQKMLLLFTQSFNPTFIYAKRCKCFNKSILVKIFARISPTKSLSWWKHENETKIALWQKATLPASTWRAEDACDRRGNAHTCAGRWNECVRAQARINYLGMWTGLIVWGGLGSYPSLPQGYQHFLGWGHGHHDCFSI